MKLFGIDLSQIGPLNETGPDEERWAGHFEQHRPERQESEPAETTCPDCGADCRLVTLHTGQTRYVIDGDDVFEQELSEHAVKCQDCDWRMEIA
jgi:transposase